MFTVCRRPTATTLLSPLANSTDVFNNEVELQWTAFTSTMIGSPCTQNTVSMAAVYIIMDPQANINPETMVPETKIDSVLTDSSTYTLTGFH